MGALLGFLTGLISYRSSLRGEHEREYHQQNFSYEIPTWAYLAIKDEPSDLYDRNDELYLKQKQEQDMRNNKQ